MEIVVALIGLGIIIGAMMWKLKPPNIITDGKDPIRDSKGRPIKGSTRKK